MYFIGCKHALPAIQLRSALCRLLCADIADSCMLHAACMQAGGRRKEASQLRNCCINQQQSQGIGTIVSLYHTNIQSIHLPIIPQKYEGARRSSLPTCICLLGRP